MNKDERYIVRIYFENRKDIQVKEGKYNLNKFFEEIFKENPTAIKASVRKIYNPLFSTEDNVDDLRTFATKCNHFRLFGQDSIVQEKKKEILYEGINYPEEIPNE